MSEKITIPSIEEMMEAGVHYGHTTSRWHPNAKQYLYGRRGTIHVIDVEKTREKLEQAANLASSLSKQGKQVLFVGVKPLARKTVKEQAIRSKSPHMTNRWIGGTLTNPSAIQSMLKRMKKFDEDKASGRLAKYTKREQLDFTEDYEKLNQSIGGIRDLSGKPGAVFIVDVKYDKTALAEARKLKIPVIALSDSNVDPKKLSYPIPANDDALKSIELITKTIADAVLAGKESNETN